MIVGLECQTERNVSWGFRWGKNLPYIILEHRHGDSSLTLRMTYIIHFNKMFSNFTQLVAFAIV